MIPFTQYLRPTGLTRDQYIDASPEIEAMADRVIDLGGTFEMELLNEVVLNLTVSAMVDGDRQDIASVLVDNGPLVPAAVDRLVIAAHGLLNAGKGGG